MIKEKLIKFYQKKSALKLLNNIFKSKGTIIEKVNGLCVQKYDERLLQIALRSQKAKIEKLQSYAKNFQSVVFVDIGANYGEFSIEMASNCSQVYSIEPNPIVFSCLLKTFGDIKNVELINCAVVPNNYKDSYADLQINPFSSGGSHLIDSRSENNKTILITSKVIKVSNLLSRISPIVFDVIIFKIDIEGYEYPIVDNIIKDFSSFKFIVMFEFIEKNSLVSINEISKQLQKLSINNIYSYCSITNKISVLNKNFSNGEILLANFECNL